MTQALRCLHVFDHGKCAFAMWRLNGLCLRPKKRHMMWKKDFIVPLLDEGCIMVLDNYESKILLFLIGFHMGYQASTLFLMYEQQIST